MTRPSPGRHATERQSGGRPGRQPMPVEPKPPPWRVVAERSTASSTRTVATAATTNCATRSPLAMVTGSLPRIVLGQWGMLPLLREVPDSVRDFIGFSIPWDPIAGTGADPAPYRAIGTAHVRNVVLPVSYSHVSLPRADHLASQPATRAWIDAFHPEERSPLPDAQDTSNLLVAAELWYGLRRHWCVGAKRVALRERVPAPTGEADARASRASR